MSWKQQLADKLLPILSERDPRPRICAYHDMPYAVFVYPEEDEFELRKSVGLLKSRLENQHGKRVTVVSLAECLDSALRSEGLDAEGFAEAERMSGLDAVIETLHEVISTYRPLDALVAERIPADAEAQRDIVLIVRAGALFPFYRTSSLLEQLKGKVTVPAVLFYPGKVVPPAGLSFMGVLDAEHNYRPKIF